MSGTTRRYRATDKTKTAKPKPKVSKRAALIAKVEKSGVKLRTDWSALRKKKKPVVVKEEKKTKTRVIAKEKDSVKRRKKFVFTAKEKQMIERIGELNKEIKRRGRRGEAIQREGAPLMQPRRSKS